MEKLRWDNTKANVFLNNLSSDESMLLIQEATETITTNVDLALKKFTGALVSAGECMRHKFCFGGKRRFNKWFDGECLKEKRETSNALRRYMKTKTPGDKTVYLQKRSHYQSLIKDKKKAHKKSIRDALLHNANDSCKNAGVSREEGREIGGKG